MESKALNNVLVDITNQETPRSVRSRSLTGLKLEWYAERLRKIERIKRQVQEGTYRIDGTVLAKALLDLD